MRCKSCSANVQWVKTENGKSMPIDEKPSPDGNIIRLDSGLYHVLKKDEMRQPNKTLYISHFATCPAADKHRKEK